MRPIRLSIFTTLALAFTLAGSGCSKSTATGGEFPNDPAPATPGTPTTPTGPVTPGTPTPTTAKYAGIYQANAPIDFTQNGVLPGLVSPALAALSLADTNPGTALVNFAHAAGVDLPGGSVVRGLVGGYLDTQLNTHLPPDVLQALDIIGGVVGIAQTAVLTNKMTVHTPKTDGTVAVDLEVSGATFSFVNVETGTPVSVTATVSAANAAAAKTSLTATLAPRPNAPVADADMTFTGGTIAVPIGDLLLDGVVPILFPSRCQQTNGKQSTLEEGLKCLLTDTCRGVGDDVDQFLKDNFSITPIPNQQPDDKIGTKICYAGVTLASIEITTQLNKLKITGTIKNGRAVLFDTSQLKPTMDHQSDRIADGTWTWSFGSTDVPSTLAGDRTGNAN